MAMAMPRAARALVARRKLLQLLQLLPLLLRWRAPAAAEALRRNLGGGRLACRASASTAMAMAIGSCHSGACRPPRALRHQRALLGSAPRAAQALVVRRKLLQLLLLLPLLLRWRAPAAVAALQRSLGGG